MHPSQKTTHHASRARYIYHPHAIPNNTTHQSATWTRTQPDDFALAKWRRGNDHAVATRLEPATTLLDTKYATTHVFSAVRARIYVDITRIKTVGGT